MSTQRVKITKAVSPGKASGTTRREFFEGGLIENAESKREGAVSKPAEVTGTVQEVQI